MKDKMKILVIDDEASVRESFKWLLPGHELLLAKDGEEGINLIKQHPDLELVITDRRMPRMDGEEVARFIQLHNQTHDLELKVIMMTSSALEEEMVKALGIYAVINKPFDVALLQAVVEAVLRPVAA